MVNWITQYGQIVAFFVQIAYWLVIAAAAVWATLMLKRYVDAETGTALAPRDEKSMAAEIKADTFVD
jgi:hypothetical protein